MPKRSTRANKNIYFTSREGAGMTRAAASEATFLSESRIEKIEYDQVRPNPEDVVAMAQAYRKPALCNYYCSNDCAIGLRSVPELKETGLTQIVLSLLDSFNSMSAERDRLIRIAADGEISPEELPEFMAIKKQLTDISVAVDTLQLWIDSRIAEGKISKEDYESLSQ